MSAARMPALFIGHGSPMNAIEDNAFRRRWQALGRELPKPRAILCISAHWETRGIYLGATAMPETIHDFYGFPKALFDVRYPAPGSPSLAQRVADLLQAQHTVHLDPGRGLDHGAWSVLLALCPRADVPVVQLSLDMRQPAAFHYGLGRALAPLRDEGVLVLGSGNAVHNLYVFDFHQPQPYGWALECDARWRRSLEAGDHAALIDYALNFGDNARLAVPTAEHYFPLLYPLALQQPGEALRLFNTAVLSSLSMSSFVIGA
ncbi:4,5-DOPA dioxygenase extradiol [Solimonas flava]|uniref:4,5-DOPA-extradiol-dioxygenase n=1 Tax=Solimonas flava TaxID=415849 RepID=UPI00041EA79F|nr:4,5-DOPA dioxygenase extradiol [Solimonas flava]